MRTLATLAALALAVTAGAQNQQAGKLPTNDQTAFVGPITIEVTATAGHADTARTTPHALYAETAGSANVSQTVQPGVCPPPGTPNPEQWAFTMDSTTGLPVCRRTAPGNNPND
ncbi:MAG: hypothetical protein OXS47_04110 [Chloroflexota bacterium]|nr:hypothetical protein [Chloroflexota bacterium]